MGWLDLRRDLAKVTAGRVLLLVLCVIWLPRVSEAQDVNPFVTPSGWVLGPLFFGRPYEAMEYTPPERNKRGPEFRMAHYPRSFKPFQDWITSQRQQFSEPGVVVTADVAEKCGPYEAHRFEYQTTDFYDVKRVYLELALKTSDGGVFLAEYDRLAGTKADPAALDALNKPCL